MKKGFTLVELSIVLVIIGLLIGGILAAQSMIGTAKVQSFIRQIQQYDVAVSNFKTQYNCLPGDCSSIALPGATPGDNDGIIGVDDVSACADDPGPGPDQDDCFAADIANFWAQLSTLGFIKDGVIYSNDGTHGVRAGVNIPKTVLGRNSGVLVTNDRDVENDYLDWLHYNLYQIYDQSGGMDNNLQAEVTGLKNSISAADALAVDTKIDDGKATTGSVRAVGSNEELLNSLNTDPVNGCVMNSDNTKYFLASQAAHPCSLGILLLSQVGQGPGQ